MKNGFTLIELSIVLVIIGLFVGGILVGQSMIESVRINKMASEFSQYSIAIMNFKQKFKQNPGDSTSFNPPGVGDGQTGGNSLYCPDPVFEELMVWSHLFQAGMISEKYEYDKAKLCPSTTADYSATGPMYLKINYLTIWQPSIYYYPLQYFDFKTVVDPELPFHSYFYHYFDPLSMSAFDKKLDDGNIETGSVAAWYASTGGACTPANFPTEKAAVSSITTMKDALCQSYIMFSPSAAPEMPITQN